MVRTGNLWVRVRRAFLLGERSAAMRLLAGRLAVRNLAQNLLHPGRRSTPPGGEPRQGEAGLLEAGYLDRVADGVRRRLEAEPEEAPQAALRAVLADQDEWFQTITRSLADTLAAQETGLAHSLARDRRILALTLEDVWGPAFRAYDAFGYASYELGAGWATEQPSTRALVWGTLLDLHARACRVAAEIGELQRAGFPTGAEARARSLHELTVTALLLGSADEEIAARYIDYAAVEQYDDASHYQQHSAALGQDPLSPEELQMLKDRRDEVVQRWGAAIKKPDGWAAPLLPKGKGGFAALEGLARVGHLRPYYRLGSHSVHAGPRASTLQRSAIGGIEHRTPGATVYGDFAETAQAALISLHQINSCLLVERIKSASEVDLLAAVMSLEQLLGRAADLFVDSAATARERGWIPYNLDGSDRTTSESPGVV
ncbi:MAG: hypothetical protein JWO98_3323 [Frankiales bacterium]|nr:hypothetical protein [Frankiales bacterium]